MRKRHCDICDKIIDQGEGLMVRIIPDSPHIDIIIDLCGHCRQVTAEMLFERAIKMADEMHRDKSR